MAYFWIAHEKVAQDSRSRVQGHIVDNTCMQLVMNRNSTTPAGRKICTADIFERPLLGVVVAWAGSGSESRD